jgi:hypothetical protein
MFRRRVFRHILSPRKRGLDALGDHTPPSSRKKRGTQTGLELCQPYGPDLIILPLLTELSTRKRRVAFRPGGWPPNLGAKQTSEFGSMCGHFAGQA